MPTLLGSQQEITQKYLSMTGEKIGKRLLTKVWVELRKKKGEICNDLTLNLVCHSFLSPEISSMQTATENVRWWQDRMSPQLACRDKKQKEPRQGKKQYIDCDCLLASCPQLVTRIVDSA